LSVPAARERSVLAIVVLQYGRWRETVACLQSLVPAVSANLARIILVDNASPDDSVQQVQRWMSGTGDVVAKPIHDTVASHWWPLVGARATWSVRTTQNANDAELPAWTLVRASENRGFACGMNEGIRRALADARIDAVWLLNNDTVVAPDAIAAIRAALETAPASVGQFGTTVCYYDRPRIVQSVGWCRWNSWLATSQRIHDGASAEQPLSRDPVQPGYVYGASWILRTAALRDVGLLTEESFLYGEELDWSCRAAARWQTRLIASATVWHREGMTIGAGLASAASRSELADLCGISVRLRLTHRFFPQRLPVVYSSVLGAVLNRLRRGDPRRAAALAKLVLHGGLPAPRPRRVRESSSSDVP
jgi:GT2 family glycosyltransferase